MKILKHYYKGEILSSSYSKSRKIYKFQFLLNGKYFTLTSDTNKEAKQHRIDYSLLTGYVILTDNKELPYSVYSKYNAAVFKKDFKTLKKAENFLSLNS